MNDRVNPVAAAPESPWRVAIWTVLYALPVAVALIPALDYDIWWHLRTGQWVVEHGTVPATDPFSQYGLETGKPWVAYSWLFEVLVYGAYRFLGYPGIFLFRAALTVAVVVALHRLVAKREPRFLVAAGVTSVALMAMLPLLNDRPWLFSILFSAVTLDVILDLRDGKPAPLAFLLPPLFALWANLHVQFVHGLFLLGLACAAPLLDRLLRREPPGDGANRALTPRWWRLVGLTAACTLATLATPYHVHLYRVVLEYGTHQVPHQLVAEFKALEFRNFWDWSVLLLGAAAAFALGRRRGLSAFDVLLLAACAWFAFRSRRDIWLLALAALALVPAARTLPAAARVFWPTWRQALATAAVVLTLAAGYWTYAVSGSHVQDTLEARFPAKAAAFVREKEYPGPLYNGFDWGGYLIWELPELPVALDGRTNLHGDARIARAQDAWLGRPGWEADPELAAARVVIADTKTPLASLLRSDPRFQLAYEDRTAVVFVAR
jgi:hypothetical protein